MGGQTLAHILLQRLGQFGIALVAGMQHDEGLDQLGALRIGLADHRGFDHRRVLDQRAFHVEGANPVAGGGDHIVGTADEADAAVCVEFHRVTAQIVVPNE
ncbi:hypothetical protein D9M68_917340 [compost metagenome]